MNPRRVSFAWKFGASTLILLLASATPAFADTNHCAHVTITNFDAAHDTNLELVINRAGTQVTQTVEVDSEGEAGFCLEAIWGVNDIFDNEPVSLHLTWSSQEATTTASVDVNVSGSPLPAYKVGTSGTTVYWNVKKQSNALGVGELGVDAAANDNAATGVAHWNPTRTYNATNPWLISADNSALTSNLATFSVWYNAPERDLRQAQVPQGKIWRVAVWYTFSGTTPAGGGNHVGDVRHNWDQYDTGIVHPPQYPLYYNISEGAGMDPGLSFTLPNPTMGAYWKCDYGLPAGNCVGPATAKQRVTVTLGVDTETRQHDSQGAFEFVVQQDTSWSANSGPDQVEVWWACSLSC